MSGGARRQPTLRRSTTRELPEDRADGLDVIDDLVDSSILLIQQPSRHGELDARHGLSRGSERDLEVIALALAGQQPERFGDVERHRPRCPMPLVGDLVVATATNVGHDVLVDAGTIAALTR